MPNFAGKHLRMAGFLFHDIIFGPVRSRRLGLSLGINLLPLHAKHCSFNCIYCECGWTPPQQASPAELPARGEVAAFLEKRLSELVAEDYLPDALTYAGNGEPTLHPQFAEIVNDTLSIRDRLAPGAAVTVLSNASMVHVPGVFRALCRLDHNIQKLDAGTEEMLRLINHPKSGLHMEKLVDDLARFEGRVTIQTMFLRGNYRGHPIDNTTPQEVDAWIGHLLRIRPKMVMIYPIARETPLPGLEKIATSELETIGQKVRAAGLAVQVYP